MGQWTPTGIEPKDYDDDDIQHPKYNAHIIFNMGRLMHISQNYTSGLLGLALMSWAFARIGVHRPSLRLPYLLFSIRSYLPLDFNRVSYLRPTYCHPFGRPFTYSLFR